MPTITSKTRLTDVEIFALRAARTLNRRIKSRHLRRVRRDRKIAVDWLGYHWVLYPKDPATVSYSQVGVKLQIVAYNPNTRTVTMQPINAVGNMVWDTDHFWFLIRNNRLIAA